MKRRSMIKIAVIATITIIAALPAQTMGAHTAVLGARAERAYDAREWASAFALYSLVSEAEPDSIVPYTRSVVAAAMRADTTLIPQVLERALDAKIPLDDILGSLEREAVALGRADIYISAVEGAARSMPYIRRPLYAAMLRYHLFRSDGPNTIKYALAMLAGRSDDIEALTALARGYLLTDKTPEAADTYRRILALDPDNFDALVALATLLADTDPSAARSYLRHACDINPTPYLQQLLK